MRILSTSIVLFVLSCFAMTFIANSSSIISTARLSSHLLDARGKLPSLPYPEGYTAADCAPESSRRQKRSLAIRQLRHVCRSVRSFSFSGRPYRVSKTQSVALVAGNTYSLSVAANQLIEGILAFTKGRTPEDARLVRKFRPNNNVATLQFRLDTAAEVFFFIVSPSNNVAGDIALWALGNNPEPPNPARAGNAAQ